MPGPEQIVRTAVGLPVSVVRGVFGLLFGGHDDSEQRVSEGIDLGTPDETPAEAAAAAVEREREPREESPLVPDPDPSGHVESEVELVAESADIGATETPGAQLHVDEPWEGYRRMKVSEITARLEGQPPEVLAAVELYEATHRNRRGVLEAVRSAPRS